MGSVHVWAWVASCVGGARSRSSAWRRELGSGLGLGLGVGLGLGLGLGLGFGLGLGLGLGLGCLQRAQQAAVALSLTP